LKFLLLNTACNQAIFNYTNNEKTGTIELSLTTNFVTNTAFGLNSEAVITVTNSGDEVVTAITASGLSEPFSITSTTCTTQLNSKSSCIYTINFSSPGAINATDTFELSFSKGTVSQALAATGVAGNFNVTPVYSGNGNWMDYVKNDEPNKDVFSQTNDACDGSEVGIHSVCIHGGEKLQVPLGAVSSCSNLEAVDTLDAFQWECKLVLGQAVFFTQGLKPGKGLADLVDFTGNTFKDNAVTILKTIDGHQYTSGNTTAAKWHTNPVSDIALDSTNVVNLTVSGSIYTVDAPVSASRSIVINGTHKVAVLVKDGVELRDSNDQDPLVYFSNANFGWMEGSFNGDYVTAELLELDNSKFIKIIKVKTRNTLSAALLINQFSYGNLIYDFTSHESSNSDESIWLDNNSHNNVFNKMLLIGAKDYGSLLFYGNGINNNIFSDVIITSTHTPAIYITNTSGSDRNTFSHFSILNGTQNALDIENGSYQTFNNFLISNHSANILMRSGSNNSLFSNFAIANGGGVAIDLSNTTGHRFTNNLLIGNNTTPGCSVSGPGAGLDAGCGIDGSSDHVLRTGIDT
jgi:hypothetical protein